MARHSLLEDAGAVGLATDAGVANRHAPGRFRRGSDAWRGANLQKTPRNGWPVASSSLARSMQRLSRAGVDFDHPGVELLARKEATMTRVQLGVRSELVSADAAWRGASAKRPCPICGGSEGCFLHEDHGFVSCGSSPSDWPLTNGTWLHRFVEPKLGLAEQASSGPCVSYLMSSPVRSGNA